MEAVHPLGLRLMSPKRSKVNWAAVDSRLPTGSDEKSRKARRALFEKLDWNHNGSLSLTEAQSSVPALLAAPRGFRRSASAAPPMVPLTDLKPAINGAFRAAQVLLPQTEGSATLTPHAFHAFLVSFRYYLELHVLFEDVDQSNDGMVGYRECMKAVTLLNDFGIEARDIKAKFPKRDHSSDIRFDDFVAWILGYHVGTLDLCLDVDEAGVTKEDEVNNSVPTSGSPQDVQCPDKGVADTANMSEVVVKSESTTTPPDKCEENELDQAENPEVQCEETKNDDIAIVRFEKDDSSKVDNQLQDEDQPRIQSRQSTVDLSSWISNLKLQYQSFEVGDQVMAVFGPTGEWNPATINTVLPDDEYIIDWDPIGTFILKSDRNKKNSELRKRPPEPEETPSPQEEEPEEATQEEDEEPDEPDIRSRIRTAAGATENNAKDPLVMMREQESVADTFLAWDKDNSGSISKEELSQVLKELNPDFSEEDISVIFEDFDKNKDGVVDYREFLDWIFGSR